jgi:uncharacterized protein (TIRG00374 family)
LKKHHLGLAIAILAVVGAATFLYFRLGEAGFEWSRFVAILKRLHQGWLWAAVALILAAYAVRAARWQVMVLPIAPQATFPQMLSATFIGFTAVVLFGRAGEPVRPYLISRKLKVSFSSQVAAWLVERILDLLMILVLFGLSLAQINIASGGTDSNLYTALRAAGWLAGLTGAACLAGLVALRRYRGRIRSRLEESLTFLPERPLARVRGFIQAFDEGMQSMRNPASIWLLVLSTMFEWGLVAAVYFTTLRAFPDLAHLTLTQVLTLMGLATFAGVIQIPGVGGGLQIAIVVVLTELYGVTFEAASAVALLLWIMNCVVAVPLGLALAFHEGIQWRTMRHVGDEENPLR